MLRVSTKDLRRLERDLGRARQTAFPHAIRNTLNAWAFSLRGLWIDEMKASFVLRNTWTTRSIRVERATGASLTGMRSTVGSVADYMDDQESGGVKTAGGRRGVAIPSSVAAGQGQGSRPRTRTVRGPNKLSAISITDRSSHPRRQVRNIIAIRRAQKAGQKFAFLESSRSRGLFKLSGGRRRLKLQLIWDLSRGSVRIPPTPTLQPALRTLRPRMASMHAASLRQQLARARVFGYSGASGSLASLLRLR